MPGVVDANIARLAGEIQRYLEGHPHASDSLEGIVHWWLTRQRYEESAKQVQQALDKLLEQRAITKCVLSDGKTLYVRRPDPAKG